MKVIIRPPKVNGGNQCFDDDRFNIKFVSHFIDVPDNQEADETTREGSDDKQQHDSESTKDNRKHDKQHDSESTKDNRKHDKTKRDLKSKNQTEGKHENKNQSSFPQAWESLQRSSVLQQRSSLRSEKSWQHDSRRSVSKTAKHYDNKNKSSRPGRNRLTSTSEQPESSYDDMCGMSSSNRRAWRYNSSDDESSQSTRLQSSDMSDNIRTDIDSEPSLDEREIVMLYSQLRQIIRGPIVNDSRDVQLLPTVEVLDAEEDKETLSPSTVVITESPPTVDPVKTSTNQIDADDERRDTLTISLHDDHDDGEPLSSTARSKAVRKAGIAACARGAKRQPYKTQPGDHDHERLSKAQTSDVVATPWSNNAPKMPELKDAARDVGEISSLDDDAGLVVARRTMPLYGRGTSPWLTDQSLTDDHTNRRAAAAAAAAAENNELVSLSASQKTLSPRHIHHQQQREQKHRASVELCHTDSTTTSFPCVRPAEVKFHSELEHLSAPPVTADPLLKAAVDQDLMTVLTNVTAESSTSTQPVRSRKSPTFARPRQLASCVEYHSATGSSSTSQAANSERQRQISFASKVKRRTLI